MYGTCSHCWEELKQVVQYCNHCIPGPNFPFLPELERELKLYILLTTQETANLVIFHNNILEKLFSKFQSDFIEYCAVFGCLQNILSS